MRHDINPPPLRDREQSAESAPGLSGEHQRLWEWVRAVLAGMRQEVRDDIDRVRAKVDSMADRLAHMEGADKERAEWRQQFDRKLDDIAGRVGRESASGVRPGTVVSVCTAGAARELEEWAQQLGATDFGPL